MTIPNVITFSRIALTPLLIALLYFDQIILGGILFIMLSLTDFLDGYLARKLEQKSDLGALIDPVADKIIVIGTLILLVEKGIAPSIPVIIITLREILISAWRSYKGESTGAVIAASLSGKVKTVFQIIAIIMLLFNLPYSESVLWISALISVYSGAQYIGKW